MRRLTLTIDDAIADGLEALAHEPTETAAILIVSRAELDDELRLIGRELFRLDAHVSNRTSDSCTIADTGLVAAAKAADRWGGGIVLVHNHPDAPLDASPRDRRAEAAIAELARTRLDQTDAGSIIVGHGAPFSFTGATCFGAARLDRIRIIGRRFRFLDAVDAAAPAPPPTVFERQVRAFGHELQQLLGTLTAGVAGFGGTGSSVGQQLIRLGLGKVIVADDDIVTDTNVTRIHGSRLADAGTPKADLARDTLEAIGFGSVEPISDAITVERVARHLRSCDVVFCCTDDHAGRLVLARLAACYRIPVIDMGVRLGADGGVLTEIVGRVSVVTPGAACGICTGTIDPVIAAVEMLTPEERERRAADGYIPDLDVIDPAVITYTTLVASIAVNELLERLIGFGVDPPPDETIILGHDRYLSTRTIAPRLGHFCSDPAVIGSGDTIPFLGITWAA
jgi:molybdopterin/thiamine biosynthesis adenylyltransferase